MNFQTLIHTLNAYWAKRGCLILQPYDVEVGAGTMHPATFFYSLGREPARVAYPQPCRRPADARYGDNPNRLGYYYQYQVILKPSPKEIQEIYLESLESLGIALKRHDVRFIEDDWESPALGAWGIGWEVWLDGLEITQFTYFQQMGGVDLFPVTVELTYGLERIALSLQDKNSIFELEWGRGRKTYGDLQLEVEKQFSAFYFEEASIEEHWKLFEIYEREGKRLCEKRLLLPAYDYTLKLSHLFNILDARGAISPMERAKVMKRIRDLAGAIAQAYLNQSELQRSDVLGSVAKESR